ncbi:MAG TPA: hypothetical protein VH413_16360 [Verrucomicrobiae bacterium]|jgi:hypothetical protein|nr:hypothetical protein [Verrucomicrobiae bacterium]
MDVLVPSSPKRLRITPTMVDDFLIDPVLAARILLSITFDAFQAAAFRILWWVPNVIDESGFGTGKSLRLWAVQQLRAMLIEEQWLCAYYQTFEAGKSIYWPNYNTRMGANPYFRAQLGKTDFEGDKDGKDNSKGPACYSQHFKNGSVVRMPAPNWLQNAIGQAGLTMNGVVIDEWTKVETMGKKKGESTTYNQAGAVTGGINQQILGRLRKANFNQHHLLWKNRVIFSATAEHTNHPSQARVAQFEREIAAGNPEYAIISFSFKDASNLKSHTGKPFKEQIIDWGAISRMHKQFTPSHFLREGLGIRRRETTGWYSEDKVGACVKVGERNDLQPILNREKLTRFNEISQALTFYFMGIDPAPARGTKSDDGAMAILRVRPRPGVKEPSKTASDWLCEFVWAYRLRGATASQWSAFIHKQHRHFGLAGICMDAQGGGIWINDEMIKEEQIIDGIKTRCVPIACIEDLERTGPNVQQILTMYRRRDPGIQSLWPHLAGEDVLYEAMHNVFQEAVVYQSVSWPKPYNERQREETLAWPEEKQWALRTLDAGRGQLVNLQVAVNQDGTFALTAKGAKQFSAGGKKKDLAYAQIYAYVRFLVWLQMAEWEFADGAGGNGEWGSVM